MLSVYHMFNSLLSKPGVRNFIKQFNESNNKMIYVVANMII